MRSSRSQSFFASSFVLLFVCSGCVKGQLDCLSKDKNIKQSLSFTYVSKDRLALFADLSSYNLVSDNVLETKSSKTELYSLEELLDFDLAKQAPASWNHGFEASLEGFCSIH